MAPEYDKAAKALKGIANIAAVDATKEQVDAQIQGYPTIKFYVDGKASDYDGPRSADGIVDFMLRKFRNVAVSLLRLRTRESEEVQVVAMEATEVTLEALMKGTWSC